MKQSIFLLVSFILLSCSDNNVSNPLLFPIDEATIGIKSKIFYPSLEDEQILSIEDFEYDNQEKLVKKTYYGGNRETLYYYELYKYDNKDRLINKLNYNSNIYSPNGFILLDSTTYTYSGDLLIAEKITYPEANYSDKYTYEYNSNKLVKNLEYHKEKMEFYTNYEYKNNKIYKELIYAANDDMVEIKEYIYDDVVLKEVVYYSFKNEPKRRINYSYNQNGKLLWEKVDELFDYSSSLPYVVKYIY